jgi:hypothetical protein
VIEKGRPWGGPAAGGPELRVDGDDADLAAVVDRAAGRLVAFRPSPASDLARALGMGPAEPAGTDVAVDCLRVTVAGRDARPAVNAIVLGRRPDRLRAWHRGAALRVDVDGRERVSTTATTVVVASGQFLHGLDVVPRGHPGDGRAEVQVYALRPGERAAMRRRLPQGAHVPHPRITQVSGRTVVVRCARAVPVEIDGRAAGRTDHLTVEVVPGALHLLV